MNSYLTSFASCKHQEVGTRQRFHPILAGALSSCLLTRNTQLSATTRARFTGTTSTTASRISTPTTSPISCSRLLAKQPLSSTTTSTTIKARHQTSLLILNQQRQLKRRQPTLPRGQKQSSHASNNAQSIHRPRDPHLLPCPTTSPFIPTLRPSKNEPRIVNANGGMRSFPAAMSFSS